MIDVFDVLSLSKKLKLLTILGCQCKIKALIDIIIKNCANTMPFLGIEYGSLIPNELNMFRIWKKLLTLSNGQKRPFFGTFLQFCHLSVKFLTKCFNRFFS